jgi:hypothetical protein
LNRAGTDENCTCTFRKEIKLRTNIDLVIGNQGTFYLKFGEMLYEFTGADTKLAFQAWNEIQNNDLKPKENNPVKVKILETIDRLGGNKEIQNLNNLLSVSGLPGMEKNKGNYNVGLLGDDDLIQYTSTKLSSDIFNYEKVKDLSTYDYFLIVTRKFNRKQQIKSNKLLFSVGKPFISLIFEPLSFSVGPLTIPKQTSCLNCKLLFEEENNYYGKILKLFNDSDQESKEYLPEELINLGLDFTHLQVFKQTLKEIGEALEPELAQNIMEYSLLDGTWTERSLIKNSRCQVCFPGEEQSQIFEVKL